MNNDNYIYFRCQIEVGSSKISVKNNCAIVPYGWLFLSYIFRLRRPPIRGVWIKIVIVVF